MNLNETGELLARIQVHDNRQIGAVTLEEWGYDLADVAYCDALQAVRDHRRHSREYLTVGHVLDGVKRIRAKRLEGFDAVGIEFPGDPDDVKGYLAWRQRSVEAVANGQTPPTADTTQLVARRMPVLDGVARRPPGRG